MEKNNRIQIEVLAPNNTGANSIVKMIQNMLSTLEIESTIITPSYMPHIEDMSEKGIQNGIESLKRFKNKITIERTVATNSWGDSKLIKL